MCDLSWVAVKELNLSYYIGGTLYLLYIPIIQQPSKCGVQAISPKLQQGWGEISSEGSRIVEVDRLLVFGCWPRACNRL